MGGPVVTISRQHGSGGEEVAALVAERLGVPVLDQEIRQRAAERAGVSENLVEEAERPASLITRILERLGSVGMMADGGAIDAAPPPIVPTAEKFRALLDDVVMEAASTGAVIIGHAAHLTLRDRPEVVRVFVQAPIEARISRVIHATGAGAAEARRQIEAQDRDRVRFYHDTYHVNWYDTRLYDCVVDTHLLGVHGAADSIVQMVERVCVARPEPAAVPPVVQELSAAPAAPAAPEPAIESEVVHLKDGEVHVRPMGSGDAGALLALFRSLPPEDLLFLRRDVTDPLVVEAWERDVIDGRTLTLLAEAPPAPGQPPVVVGEASLYRNDVPWTSHVGEVRAITSPAYRGRGLGHALLTEVLRAAHDAGIDKVVAETMAEQAGAQRALTRLGFVEEGRYAGFARDLAGQPHDLVVMTFTRPPEDETGSPH